MLIAEELNMFSINSSGRTSPNKATHLLTLLVTERDDAYLVPCFELQLSRTSLAEDLAFAARTFLFSFALFCIFASNQNEKQFQ